MHLRPPALVVLLVALSFSSASAATSENLIRVPLERRSFVAPSSSVRSPDHDASGLARRVDCVAGNAMVDILKNHIAQISAKYGITLAAFESNTGSLHPLALSAIVPAPAEQKASGVGTTLPAGRIERRRRKRDVALTGSVEPTTHVPRGRYSKRDGISLSEVNGNMWMGTLSVGTPPQNFTVDIDTGSADLILPDKACDSTCDGHTRYDPHASSTSVDLGTTFQLTYGGGSRANGTQYRDNVYVGGYEAANQTFGSATTYSQALRNPKFRPDGLLGMGFATISTFRSLPVFQTMVSAGAVQQAVFGVALSSDVGKSELTLGGTNPDMYQESTVEYVNVSLPAYWQIPLAGLARPGLNNTPDVVLVNKTTHAQSIIDTGTTLIVTTDQNAKAFYAAVAGAAEIGGGLWSVPCDIVGSLAPTLVYGSRSFPVSPSTFSLGPVSNGSTDCIAGLAGGGSDWWIVGDVFLQNVYTIFDLANTRIGFANLA